VTWFYTVFPSTNSTRLKRTILFCDMYMDFCQRNSWYIVVNRQNFDLTFLRSHSILSISSWDLMVCLHFRITTPHSSRCNCMKATTGVLIIYSRTGSSTTESMQHQAAKWMSLNISSGTLHAPTYAWGQQWRLQCCIQPGF
jgi:hypothetical protein